ncbi:L-threonylcarbamoyladenylate synthase [uncultured Roseibium sp.]|uniref:L-threonylcarbamoyladenylate synthase n=1 Tax=uncultured Roseibium sp. TaxID=1936171 RepID=UPI0025956A54|nr:L-threonylcarbamoyladenylate synthase [uncultured Roseibium sp.]
MRRWTLDLTQDDWRNAAEAAAVRDAIKAGELVAIPTETVYGLAADATSSSACAKIFAAKGRPQFNPLISHLPSLEACMEHGIFDEDAMKLAKAFWPGPLTLVVSKKPQSTICDLATAGLDTVALRVPAGPVMRFLAEKCGSPLAAPSANISGKVSTTTADAVTADLGASLSFVVDAGPCSVGIESTIVALVDGTPRLLRPGGIPRKDLEAVLGRALIDASTPTRPNAPQAPGMLSSHYAPSAAVRLNAQAVQEGEALLAFGPHRLPGADGAVCEINLSPAGNLEEAAARLFAALRHLDTSGAETICVQTIPMEGLGEAINDRLERAAAPRPNTPS